MQITRKVCVPVVESAPAAIVITIAPRKLLRQKFPFETLQQSTLGPELR